MRKITVEITLNDEWEEYFSENFYTSNELIIEDLFGDYKKDGVENIELINRGVRQLHPPKGGCLSKG